MNQFLTTLAVYQFLTCAIYRCAFEQLKALVHNYDHRGFPVPLKVTDQTENGLLTQLVVLFGQ